MTLRQAMHKWLFETKKFEVSINTFEQFNRTAQTHIYPNIGDLEITQISPNNIKDFKNGLEQKGIGYSAMRKCSALLRRFFEHCLCENYICENANKSISHELRNTDLAKQAQITSALTKDELKQAMSAISFHRFWKPFCFTFINTKIAINEILALTWGDVDFDTKRMLVDKAVVPALRFDKDDKISEKTYDVRYYNMSPPTRTISLSNKDVALLDEYRRYRKREERNCNNEYSFTEDDDLIFGNDKGELRSMSGISHVFKKFLKSKGLKGEISIQRLRTELSLEDKKPLAKLGAKKRVAEIEM